MLRHEYLYDPINRVKDFELSEFTKYVKMREAQGAHEPTDPDIVGAVRDEFYGTHTDVPKEKLNDIWRVIGPMSGNNAAFSQFVLDYGGAKSEFFFPWLITIAKSPSRALEMSYGSGYDLKGDWVRVISDNDKIARFIHDMPTLVFNRERELFMADLVASVQDKGTYATPTKVLDLGAGRMTWARWHGFQFAPGKQRIIAYDKDPSIDPSELFECTNLERLGLNYCTGDLFEAFSNPDCKNADLIMLAGVASYMPLETFVSAIMMPVYGFLKHGGVFFFDLQLDCPQYEWTIKLFDWPEMNLAKNPEALIAQLERVRRELWEKGLKFGAEYQLDTYNMAPSAVMVTLTKI